MSCPKETEVRSLATFRVRDKTSPHKYLCTNLIPNICFQIYMFILKYIYYPMISFSMHSTNFDEKNNIRYRLDIHNRYVIPLYKLKVQ